MTWTGSDGSSEGIYARRYDANGQPLAGEILVNLYTDSRQKIPCIAMSSNGDFVIVWESYYHSTHDWYTRGQLYNSSGTPVGGEFIISQESHGFPPDVAMDDSGDFVVIFEKGPGYYVYMRMYNANGTAKGSAVDVSGNLYARSYPSIGMAGGGNYVVAWTYDSESGSYSNPDVYAKRYDSSGSAIGAVFVVNTYTDGGQWLPSVAMNDDGDFTVLWDMGNIYGQRYKSDGTSVGDEFQINTYIVSEQRYADVAMKDNSEFVVVWQSNGQDGSDYGIFGEFGPKICCADFSGDLFVNLRDFAFLAQEWLQEGDLLQTDLVDDNKIDELDLGALYEQWLTPCYECSQADIYSDGKIDFKDYSLLAGNWLDQGPLVGDITGNGTVDMADLRVLIFYWLMICGENQPPTVDAGGDYEVIMPRASSVDVWLDGTVSDDGQPLSEPTLTYTADSGYVGYDSIVFRVYDGLFYSPEATVTIEVLTTE